MNISYRWLRALAPAIEGTPQELADRLGMLGAPVDELTELGASLADVVIARVEEVRSHPNADRLRVCAVVAGGAPVQVVCGAPNVEAGRYYPFAPVGSTLPGGMEIRRAKLRGEVSEGMLCSARELGLGRDHAGLLALEGEWEPGSSFVEQLGLDDARLVLDITSNRPDLLSHFGVARELAPGGAADLGLHRFPGWQAAPMETTTGADDVSGAGIRVRVEERSGCPRYMAAVVEGVRVGPSPEWLGMRLRAIGVRPINNVVDATNYVLFELGQPLHAFDLDRLAGPEIRVRHAAAGESIRTLDGIERALPEGTLVIADRDRPVALAGVMGGEESEVGAGTTRVLLECALFDPRSVRRTARALGLATDASHRFERGVDPEGQSRALHRVVELILAVAGGSVPGPALDVHAARQPAAEIDLRPARVRKLLGVPIDEPEIDRLLLPLGFISRREGERLRVRVPSFRPDVSREVDLIEEIARRRGYDSFAEELGYYRPGTVPDDDLVRQQAEIHELFRGWGFREARTAGFAPPSDERVPLLNPLSSEESHLREELTAGLLRRVEHNWAHGSRAIRLYEIGTVFRPAEGRPHEEIRVAAVFTGPSAPPHWSGPPAAWDVWDLKGLLEALGHALGGGRVDPVAQDPSVREPRRAPALALRSATGERLGQGAAIGRPEVDAPAWADPLWALEVVLRPRPRGAHRAVRPLPAFPAIERDVALLVPVDVEARRVEEVIRENGSTLLEEVVPFDLYLGEGIPDGTRSLAWRLRFRHPERTLTDAETDQVVAGVEQALEEALGVRRR